MTIIKTFHFEFSPRLDHDEDPDTYYYFEFYFKDEDEFKEKDEWEGSNEGSLDFCMEIEGEYGLHDFGTSGYDEFAGYHSNEIAPDRQEELMNKWRDHYVSNGFNCGPVIKMPDDELQIKMKEDEEQYQLRMAEYIKNNPPIVR